MKKICSVLFILFLGNTFYTQIVSTTEIALQSSLLLSASNSFSGYNEEQVLPDEITYSNVRGNFGAGLSFGIDFYKKISPQIKFGFNISYFKGFEVLILNYNRDSLYQNLVGSTNQVRFSPKLTFSVPLQKITFLMESSILIPLRSQSKFSFNGLDKTTDSSLLYTEKYNYDFAFGFSQKLGFEAKLTNHFTLKSTLGILLFNQTIKERKIESFSVNGKDQLNELTIYEKESLYRQNLNNFSNNYDYNALTNDKLPKDELKLAHQFSAFEFSLTLIYKIGPISSSCKSIN